jgi:hypothetical protein
MIMFRAFLLLTAAFFASAALAAPRSIADCEAIQAADAYNHCLASFGPVRGGGRKYLGAASEPAHGASSGHGRRYSSTASFQRSHAGRMRMEFTPAR